MTMTLAQARAKTPWLADSDFAKFVAVCRKQAIPPWGTGLAIFNESGWHPTAQNTTSGASGLIQWMEGNAPGGYSNAQVRTMTFSQQMDLVGAWMATWAHKGVAMDSGGKVYATIFLPGRLVPGSTEDTVLTKEGESFYNSNRILDFNHDKEIEVSDLTALLNDLSTHSAWEPLGVRLKAAGGGPEPFAGLLAGAGGGFVSIVALAVGMGSLGVAYWVTGETGVEKWVSPPWSAFSQFWRKPLF